MAGKSVTLGSLSDRIDQLVTGELVAQAGDIDRQGLYPAAFLAHLGALGGFRAALPTAQGGLGLGLFAQVDIGSRVAAACGSTAFAAWCQTASAWYLARSPNAAVRDRHLASVASGTRLAGSGMSNAVKHLAGIEKMLLKAHPDGSGYRVSGVLPWVSNLGPDHLLITAAALEDGVGQVMFAVDCRSPAVSLHDCPDFSGMEGTRTFNVRINDLQVPAEDVLAHPAQFQAFIASIKPGFLLSQMSLGLGLVTASIDTIRQTNQTHAHVNVFLDDQDTRLAADLEQLTSRIQQLAKDADAGRASLLGLLQARAESAELALRATQSAALHAGARGYLMRHPAQRRLREALFVAIVTPALKHLRKEIHTLEAGQPAEAV